MNSRRLVASFVAALALVPGASVAQQSFPTKPITLVIESGAGGMADVMTRAVAKIAEKDLGQPIVCENRPGGAMTIAKHNVLKAKPDGYTLGVATTATNINIPHMRELPYDVFQDQRDIAVYFKYTHALAVKADAPWKTFEEVVEYARRNPGKFTYATAGVGVTQHITMERIAMKEGIKVSMVPFKSGSEAALAALGGHTMAVAQGPADLVPHVQSGKLRLLLALNDNRWSVAPAVPTVQEKYGFFGINYQTIFGPKGIPEPIARRLESAFKKAVQDPSYLELAKSLQVDTYYMSGNDYDKFWKSQYDEMGRVIKTLGLAK
jgi:tripartite-type tricarboxylate transporter receptor subunit TctC